MTPSHALREALGSLLDAPLVYVDCGARAGKLPKAFRAVGAQYVGFEADAAECARLNASAPAWQRYVAAFLGERKEPRTFHVTASAACSSLLAPNLPALEAFADLPAAFSVERTIAVETVSLADALREADVGGVDFLELDTQGTELEILRGSAGLLREQVLGVRVEVEFSPMYVDQPLFADVDAFMRAQGFQLFDLARYRVRRSGLEARVPTRGQLLWGQALYLRDDRGLSEALACRLAVVAVLAGVPDYAYAILQRVAGKAVEEVLRLLPRGLAVDDDSPLLASRDRSQWRD